MIVTLPLEVPEQSGVSETTVTSRLQAESCPTVAKCGFPVSDEATRGAVPQKTQNNAGNRLLIMVWIFFI
jgi:hypothetical protein